MLNIINRILRLAGDSAHKIRLGFLLGFLDGIFNGTTFVALMYAFTAINRKMTQDDLITVIAIQATGLIGHFICRYCVARFQGGAGVEIISKQRLIIGDILKRVPMGFFSRHNPGEISATVTTDLSFIELYGMHILDRVVNGFISTLVVSVFILIYDWRIGLIFIASLIPMAVVFNILQKRGKILSPKRQDSLAKLASAVLEYIRGMEVIKAFNLKGTNAGNISQALNQNQKHSFRLEKGFTPLFAIYFLIIKFCCAVIIFTACMLTMEGDAAVTDLFIIIIATFAIFSPIEQAASLTSMMRLMEASLNRLEKITNAKLMDANAKAKKLKSYDIEFKDVSFAYDTKEVIKKLSFRAAQNTTTAIVGASGSGKTTVACLAARFWDTNQGSVTVGGVDVRDLSCDSILKNISMVFQNVYLFNDTVFNNLKVGRPQASMQDVIKACRKARCHDFILSLANGYQTIIGEGGATLSGGEKQRISIARAILKDAPIVLLDEATSNIDPENEHFIQQAINNLIANKTLIVIAHRLTSIKDVDNILVLDNGKLSQQGRHDQLINQPGIYKDFWDIRQKADAWKVAD